MPAPLSKNYQHDQYIIRNLPKIINTQEGQVLIDLPFFILIVNYTSANFSKIIVNIRLLNRFRYGKTNLLSMNDNSSCSFLSSSLAIIISVVSTLFA